MHIETKRMIVRDFIPEDLKDLHEIFGDEQTMENCEPAYDLTKTEKFLHEFCIQRRGAVAASLKENGKVIGYILFNEFEKDVYEIGWIFNRSFWRKGYAYESCGAVIDHAFRQLKAHKLFAEAIDTVRSVPLMKKLGMLPEGVQRRQTKDAAGNWTDLYFYGLLEDDR